MKPGMPWSKAKVAMMKTDNFKKYKKPANILNSTKEDPLLSTFGGNFVHKMTKIKAFLL